MLKINVGGKVFEAEKEVFYESPHLKKLFKKYRNEIPKVDRSANAFRHVLKLLEDPDYDYPAQHYKELDYYSISYTRSNVWIRDHYVHIIKRTYSNKDGNGDGCRCVVF